MNHTLSDLARRFAKDRPEGKHQIELSKTCSKLSRICCRIDHTELLNFWEGCQVSWDGVGVSLEHILLGCLSEQQIRVMISKLRVFLL